MMEEFDLIIKLSIISLVFSISLYFDLKYQRIPNLLCAITLITGFMIQSFFSGWSGLLSAFTGAGLAFLILFPAFCFKLFGAGDVKLMVAIGSFLDVKLLLWSIIYSLVAGAITSICIAVYKLGWQAIKEIFLHYVRCLYLRQFVRPDHKGFLEMKIPYAPAFAIGWVWACSQNSHIMWLMTSLRYQLGV